jgi:hypothetical protein
MNLFDEVKCPEVFQQEIEPLFEWIQSWGLLDQHLHCASISSKETLEEFLEKLESNWIKSWGSPM